MLNSNSLLVSVAVIISAAGALGQQTRSTEQYRPSSYPETYQQFYPAAEVRTVPDAMARAAVARAQLRRAISALDQSVADMRREFQRSSEWVAAVNDEQAAYRALLQARQEATAELKGDASYQAAMALRRRLAEQITDYRDRPGMTVEGVVALATVKLGYSATATAMEQAAIASDPRVKQARLRLVAAGARVSALRAQFNDSVRGSPQILAARKELEDARIARLAAEAYLVGSLDARSIAMDYAYYLHRYDRYKYLSYGSYGRYYDDYFYDRYRIGYPRRWWQK